MPILAYDLIAALLILYFVFSGYRNGFFLTLCNLIATFVAFFGAVFVTIHFAPVIANIVSPMLQSPIEALLNAQTEGSILAELESSPLWSGFLERIDVNLQDSVTTIALSLAAFVALQLTRIALFLISFLVIMAAWFMLSRTLNLAFRLPIISGLNDIGGLVIGLIQGCLMVYLLVWILSSGFLTTSELESTYLLNFFLDNSPIALIEATVSQL